MENRNTRNEIAPEVIVAVGRNMEIGAGNRLLWPIREDLRHFKETTMGHPLIMGRLTWESLPKRPLPGRPSYVVSRNASYACPGATLCGSLEEALVRCTETAEAEPGNPLLRRPMVIGGASIYAQALPLACRLHLTRIAAEAPCADAFFPVLDEGEWLETYRSEEGVTPEGIRYSFHTLERISRGGD